MKKIILFGLLVFAAYGISAAEETNGTAGSPARPPVLRSDYPQICSVSSDVIFLINFFYAFDFDLELALTPNISAVFQMQYTWEGGNWDIFEPYWQGGYFNIDTYYFNLLARYYVCPDGSPSLRGFWLDSGFGLKTIRADYPFEGESGLYPLWLFDMGYKFVIGRRNGFMLEPWAGVGYDFVTKESGLNYGLRIGAVLSDTPEGPAHRALFEHAFLAFNLTEFVLNELVQDYTILRFRLTGDVGRKFSIEFNPLYAEIEGYRILEFPLYARYYLTRNAARNGGGFFTGIGGGPRIYRYETGGTNAVTTLPVFGVRMGYTFRFFRKLNLVVEPAFELSAVLDPGAGLVFEGDNLLAVLSVYAGIGF